MNLKPVIQSEVSQKEKNNYISAYIWNLENGTDEPICRDRMGCRYREWTCGHSSGGESGTNGGSNRPIYTTMRGIDNW